MLMPSARSVAVIDDDPRVLSSLGNLLASSGYSTRLFASPNPFFLADLQGIFCVVTDLGMRPTDGLNVLRWTKQRQCRLPVVVITGRPREKSRDDYIAEGAAGFFRKPIDGDALIALIDTFS
jgi:FixJ family two-component response regulator